MATCAVHSDAPAAYRCEGCEKTLCQECVDESHTLILCKQCGERAMPLDSAQPADVRQLAKARIRAKPYTLAETFSYPFRGTSKFIFVSTIIVVVLSNMRSLWATAFFTGVLAALQFHIVRDTVRGNNELENWPDISNWGDILGDLFAWMFLEFPLRAVIGIYIGFGFFTGIMGIEPSFGSAVFVALILWLGSAYQVIGYGVVGGYSLRYLFLIHLHFVAFKRALGDAIKYTNLLFALRIPYLALGVQVAEVDIMSPDGGFIIVLIVAALFEAYWAFIAAHLSGLLFRRHEDTFDEIYSAA